MKHQEKLFRVGIAINELYKHGEAVVLLGDIFQAVGDALDRLKIEHKFEAFNDTHNRIFL